MYKNYKSPTNSRFFFVMVAVMACVLIVAGLVASHGALFQRTGPKDTQPPVTDPAPGIPSEATGSAEDTTTAPDGTTEEPVTELPATDPVTTDAPITDPPATESGTSAPDVPPSGDYILGETPDAGVEYQDKIVFLGDSTTYSLLYYGVLSGGKDSLQVWTPKSRTLSLDLALTTTILYPETGDEITIKEAVAQKKPEKKDYFISVYTKLVKLIQDASPDTEIILQSIYPVARSWEKTKSINNERIRLANEWICQVAEDCGIHYLDTIRVLADEEGFLPESYQNGDGLHLNAASCGIVLNYIRTHALPGYITE